MTLPVGTIEVQATPEGYRVVGRMGAVLRANKNKEVIYSNMTEEATEYKRMVKKLQKHKD